MSDFNLKLALGKATDPLMSLQSNRLDGPDGNHKLK